MNRLLSLACIYICSSLPSLALEPLEFLEVFCIDCHGADSQKGDRRFDALISAIDELETLEHWQEIADQLTLGEMPPKKADQPTAEERRDMLAWINPRLKEARKRFASDHSKPLIRRLNRNQYNHTVRDLLHLEPMLTDVTERFPPDGSVENLDTIASALVTSDFQMQAYLDAAGTLIRKASHFGPKPAPKTWRFQAPFCDVPARPDGQDEPGKWQNIRKNTSYEDGFLWLKKLSEGVPRDGWYTLRFKAQGINRDYPYDEALLDVSKSEPLLLSVVAGHPAFGQLRSSNGSDRPLGTVELPDEKPAWFEMRVWLDQGFQPRFSFPNGPYRTKPLRGPLVTRYPETFKSFIDKYVAPGDGEFRRLDPKYTRLSDTESKKRSLAEVGAGYSRKNTTDGWLRFTRDYQGPRARIFEITLSGPHAEQWPPPSHRALYGDRSPTLKQSRAILKAFATKAFRRAPTKTELDGLQGLVRSHRAAGHSEAESIQAGLQAVLCSPGFLYLDPLDDRSSAGRKLATRLSYFLWASPADEALLALADSDRLSNPKVLQQQALRLLRDPKAQRFQTEFLDAWLHLDKLGTQLPEHDRFPEYYNHMLEAAMVEETRLFFAHVLRENLPIRQFIQSDFSYLNAALARHYGIKGVKGHAMQLVSVDNPRRGGLLGQASILTVSANGIDTSPVIRGIWVLENLLGTPPNPPPPDIEPIEPDIRGVVSIRQQLEKHREAEACATCHAKIDGLGFALENFDPIGGWRENYTALKKRPKVDASGNLPDGSTFSNVVELKQLLLKREEQIARHLCQLLLSSASGRHLGSSDRGAIESILDQCRADGFRLQDLVLAVVQSPIFWQAE